MRTVFPLAWIVAMVIFLFIYLLVGGMVAAWVGGIADLPLIDPAAGVATGVLLSVLFGFFATIGATICAAIVALAYNFLAAMGGGIALQMEPEPAGEEESEVVMAVGNPINES